MPKRKSVGKAAQKETESSRQASQDPDYVFEVVVEPKHNEASQYVSDFDPRLNLKYSVLGNGDLGAWEQLKTYRAFQIAGSSIPVGSCIYVRGDENQGNETATSDNPEEQVEYVKWAAQVLECRAPNAKNVFLRVAWLYWPDDLAPYGKRQAYHGEMEVVPSNDMQIINALSVDGPVEVHQWQDSVAPNLSQNLVNSGHLIWRQTLDVHAAKNKPALLPKLTRHCICRRPAKPELYLIQCNHCQRWMHEECINSHTTAQASQKHPSESNLRANGETQGLKSPSPSKFIAKFVDQVRSTIEMATAPSTIKPTGDAQEDEKQDTANSTSGQLTRPTKRKRANTKVNATPSRKRKFEIPEIENSPRSKAEATDPLFTAEVNEDFLAGLESVPTLLVTDTTTGESWKVHIECLFKDCGKVITSDQENETT